MNPGAESGGTYAVDVLGTLASGLGVDSTESGRKALEVVRARAPELVKLSGQTGEDMCATSAGCLDMLPTAKVPAAAGTTSSAVWSVGLMSSGARARTASGENTLEL